ncbi:hypothetical protein HanPSC8_Chr01g0040121 [Helianthus annuus]|nr:hypothetical protein HanPSC8_Chr01g0040121 [Helianthus annuus]
MRKKAERDPEPATLRQPAPRVLASHPQKRSRRVYFSRLGFRSSSGNFRLPPVRFWRGSGEVPEKISVSLGLGSLEREREVVAVQILELDASMYKPGDYCDGEKFVGGGCEHVLNQCSVVLRL